MNVKTSKTKKQVNLENQAINLLSKEELSKRIEVVEKELRSYTWRELETNGKFAKNDKLSFITDDMLIVGCDIGSETHYIRAIDVRGRELSRGAFEFSNTAEGLPNNIIAARLYPSVPVAISRPYNPALFNNSSSSIVSQGCFPPA